MAMNATVSTSSIPLLLLRSMPVGCDCKKRIMKLIKFENSVTVVILSSKGVRAYVVRR